MRKVRLQQILRAGRIVYDHGHPTRIATATCSETGKNLVRVSTLGLVLFHAVAGGLLSCKKSGLLIRASLQSKNRLSLIPLTSPSGFYQIIGKLTAQKNERAFLLVKTQAHFRTHSHPFMHIL